MYAVSEANPQKKGKVQEETEETTSDDVSSKEKGKGKGRTCYSCGEQGHHEVPSSSRERNGQVLAPTATVDTVQPWLLPEAVELVAHSKGKGKGPDQSSDGERGVSFIGQEGLFNFPQPGCVNTTQCKHDYWTVNEVDNCGDGNLPGRLAQMCKTKEIEKIEPASQCAEAVEQFQLVRTPRE